MDGSLKSALNRILDVAISVAGPGAKALLGLAKWAVSWFTTDDQVVANRPVFGAAPDMIKAFVSELFDRAAALVTNEFYKKAVMLARDLVVANVLDRAWDALFGILRDPNAPEAVLISDEACAKLGA